VCANRNANQTYNVYKIQMKSSVNKVRSIDTLLQLLHPSLLHVSTHPLYMTFSNSNDPQCDIRTSSVSAVNDPESSEHVRIVILRGLPGVNVDASVIVYIVCDIVTSQCIQHIPASPAILIHASAGKYPERSLRYPKHGE
jgi:hypothetical protein